MKKNENKEKVGETFKLSLFERMSFVEWKKLWKFFLIYWLRKMRPIYEKCDSDI